MILLLYFLFSAFARIEMYESFMRLIDAGELPIYTDTDSIYLVKRKNQRTSLNIGSAFLQFEDEYPGNY